MPEQRRAVTALYGGTFDPPHAGHLAVARAVHTERRPALLVVAVAGTPPHRDEPLLSASKRFRLCEVAFGELPHTEVSDFDLERDPAYAIDTIAHLEYRYDRPVELVIGADQLAQLPTWHEAAEVLRRAHIVVARRPSHASDTEFAAARRELIERGAQLTVLDAVPPSVDATTLRARILDGSVDGLRGLVPDLVIEELAR